MHQVNIHEAKTHLSRLIQEALDGQEIIIAKGGRPLVRLEVLPEARSSRRVGGLPGLVLKIADDFDEPMDDFSDYMG